MTAEFSRPVQLAAGEGIEGFRCGVEIVDSWAARHRTMDAYNECARIHELELDVYFR